MRIVVLLFVSLFALAKPSTSQLTTGSDIERKVLPTLSTSTELEPLIGKPIPDFEFIDLNGRTWKSSDLKGKVIYLNIWFTGCSPCIEEIPALNSLFDEFKTTTDVVMLSVSPWDSADSLRAFTATKPIKLPLASVPFALIKKLAMPSNTIGFPVHLIIDRNGNYAVASMGSSKDISDRIRNTINAISNSPKPQAANPVSTR